MFCCFMFVLILLVVCAAWRVLRCFWFVGLAYDVFVVGLIVDGSCCLAEVWGIRWFSAVVFDCLVFGYWFTLCLL